MVKDVSASCAVRALRAHRIIRLEMAALLTLSGAISAAELPASISLPASATSTEQTTPLASPLQPFVVESPASGTPELVSSQEFLKQQQLTIPVSNSLQLSVAMGGSEKTSAISQEFAGTTGTWQPLDRLSFKAGIGMSQQSPAIGPDSAYALPVQSSICAAGSSTYLNCLASHDNVGRESMQTYMVGASWKAFGRVSVSLDYTSSNLESSPAELGSAALLNNSALLDQIGQPGASFSSRTQALDFSLSCDIGAGNWGDLELGLQVSRIMSDGALISPENASSLTDPYTHASLGVGWQLGDFRSDFTSRYLDVIDGQGNNQTPWTSLDVNFSWRTPWNGSLSVGARNVFNNPAPENSGLVDPNYDELFGRVPYVRYRQDL